MNAESGGRKEYSGNINLLALQKVKSMGHDQCEGLHLAGLSFSGMWYLGLEERIISKRTIRVMGYGQGQSKERRWSDGCF